MDLNPIPSVKVFLAVCNVVSIVEQRVIQSHIQPNYSCSFAPCAASS